MKIKQNNNFLIYTLSLLPLLSLGMVSISIALFIIGSIINFTTNRTKQNNYYSTLGILIIFSAPFILNIIAILWTDHFSTGIGIIRKTLPFFLIPATILFLKPFQNFYEVNQAKKFYIISTIILVIITLVFISFNLIDILDARNNYFINIKLRKTIENVPVVGEHPIYFSLLIAIALLLLFYNRFKNKYVNVISYFILLVGLFIASSRGVLIASSITVILIGFRKIKSSIYRLSFVILFAVSLIAIVNLPPMKARIEEVTNSKYLFPQGVHYNSFNIRMAIYKCSFFVIKEKPLLGYGSGDVQGALNRCYDQYETDVFNAKTFNTHNQFLDYWASFGIIGLIIILICIFYLLKVALKNSNFEYFNFLVLIIISMFTENILSRNTGIVLFVYLNCLLYYPNLLKKDLNDHH